MAAENVVFYRLTRGRGQCLPACQHWGKETKRGDNYSGNLVLLALDLVCVDYADRCFKAKLRDRPGLIMAFVDASSKLLIIFLSARRRM